jgi:hypothetical protein
MSVKVSIGVACAPHQIVNWWLPVMNRLLDEQRRGIEIQSIFAISSALPDHNKNHTVSSRIFANPEEKRRSDLTDANRAEITARFLDEDAEWLWFIDDDTVPPRGALSHLLSLGRPFAAGLYFNPKPPYNPIAYLRRPDGLYRAYYGYAPGTLVQVDSVGMGCTLIHRSVFEDIRRCYTVFQRPDGSLTPVHNDRVMTVDESEALGFSEPVALTDGEGFALVQPLTPVREDDNRPWPFFALEYGRTEDHHFCEMAGAIGFKPWLDTSLVCEHWKHKATTVDDYLEAAGENS